MKSALRWILLPAACLHLLTLGYAWYAGEWYLKDSLEYGYAADNLIREGRLYAGPPDEPFRTEYLTKRPPVYPFLIGVFRSMTGGDGFLLLLQAGISLFTLWLTCRLIFHIYPSFKQWKWLLPFILLYPAQYIYANLVMTELWLQAILLGMTFALWKGWERGQIKWVWIYSGLLVVGMFTKPVLYLFVFPHLVVVGLFIWRYKRWTGVFAALLPLLLMLGYMQMNKARTGYFHFSSIQNLSLLQYTTTSYLIQTEGYDFAEAIVDTLYYRAQRNPDFAEGQRNIQAGCVDILFANPGRYALYHLRGMMNFFLDPGRFDLFTFLQIESVGGGGLFDAYSIGGYRGIWQYLGKQPVSVLALLLLVALINGLKMVALPVSLLHKHFNWIERGILLLFILYIAGLTGISGASRFAVPVFPLLLLGVGGALAFWQSRNAKG
ncbi:MAG: hypothetical protein AAFV07_00535 [Bacteroidota bacterium]